MTHLVSYDLNRPGQKYPELFAAIENLGSVQKILKSAWLVDSTLKTADIFQRLWATMDATDHLFVNELTTDWKEHVGPKATEWLERYA